MISQQNERTFILTEGKAAEISGQAKFVEQTKLLFAQLWSRLEEHWNDTGNDNDPNIDDLTYYNHILSL
jgi:hypothetical protein